MSNNPNSSKAKIKRPSKGQRTHVRRLKQEARNAGTVYKAGNQS
jgi:hypothetical protein